MKRLLTIIAICFAFIPLTSKGQEVLRPIEGIAAIVNDEVISLYDVDQRVRLLFATSGLPRTPEMLSRVREQVVRTLVDEKLQMQEARRVEIEIENEEIEQSLDELATQNNMGKDDIKKTLSDSDIDVDTLYQQIEAELAWSQFVRRMFGGRLSIGEQEIDEQYERIIQALDQPRYLIQEILLGTDSNTNTERVQALSQEIVGQLQKGADFAAIAQQFSIAPSAARGGQVGWVTEGQLAPEITNILQHMSKGRISPPIYTPAGIYIIALHDKAAGQTGTPLANKYDLLAVIFPPDTSFSDVESFANDFTTCKAAETDAIAKGARSASRTGAMALRDFIPSLQNILLRLEAGQFTPPIKEENRVALYIVCDRKDDVGLQVSRQTIENNLYAQRLSMMSRRHLRDLQRDAVVEYR